MRDSLTVVLGGTAGQGIATAGEIMAKLLAKSGHNFVAFQGYHSRIRGGHNTFTIKISPSELAGPEEQSDMVISLNAETDVADGPSLRSGGLLLAFSDHARVTTDASILQVPYKNLSAPREWNLVALGILISALNLSFNTAHEIVANRLKGKDAQPRAALTAGYKWAEGLISGQYTVTAFSPEQAPRMVINGNDALALGAAAGGVNFCSFYPMSPATSVSLNLANWAAEAGLIVEQAEDEIAAVNMALGAAYGGASSLVGTSGGGFALMTEGISLAAMTETPLVTVIVQRPGPATGLPTRTEQGDLNLALYAGHGEFPRAILAPSSAEECFELAAKAVELAEYSQGPVFVLSDQYLADSLRPIAPFNLKSLPEAVNTLKVHSENLENLAKDAPYHRYDVNTKNGISPRLLPGFSDHLVKADSDEHTPDGHITEDLSWRVKMQNKRLNKKNWLQSRVIPPYYQGSDKPELLLVSWGSTKGAGLDALAALEVNGINAGLLHFNQVYPLNSEQWLPKMQMASKVIFVESNAEAQFAQLVCRESGFRPHHFILRYDGLPLTSSYILDCIGSFDNQQSR